MPPPSPAVRHGTSRTAQAETFRTKQAAAGTGPAKYAGAAVAPVNWRGQALQIDQPCGHGRKGRETASPVRAAPPPADRVRFGSRGAAAAGRAGDRPRNSLSRQDCGEGSGRLSNENMLRTKILIHRESAKFLRKCCLSGEMRIQSEAYSHF